MRSCIPSALHWTECHLHDCVSELLIVLLIALLNPYTRNISAFDITNHRYKHFFIANIYKGTVISSEETTTSRSPTLYLDLDTRGQ